MKAEELRIGNYVKDTHGDWGVMKIESILSSACRIYLHTLDEEYLADFLISDAEPIPLTPEWLAKFGFRKHKMHGYDRHFEYHHYKLNNPITSLYDAEFAMSLDNCARTVQYVHQLQNLYFMLTREELTIKP